jgi:hypothetical protein
MEINEFDGLTRALSGAGSSRRLALRILGGMLLSCSLVGVVATRDPVALAAKKNHRAGPARHGATLHDEGKHRKKKHHRKSEQTQQTQQTQQCSDGQRRCTDGQCVSPGQCCSDEHSCPDGSCVAAGACCAAMTPPDCGECQEAVCHNGALVCRSTCRSEGAVCCGGTCMGPCTGGQEINPVTCQCACPSGSVLLADGITCCPRFRACGLNQAGQGTFCCDEANICMSQGQRCS